MQQKLKLSKMNITQSAPSTGSQWQRADSNSRPSKLLGVLIATNECESGASGAVYATGGDSLTTKVRGVLLDRRTRQNIQDSVPEALSKCLHVASTNCLCSTERPKTISPKHEGHLGLSEHQLPKPHVPAGLQKGQGKRTQPMILGGCFKRGQTIRRPHRPTLCHYNHFAVADDWDPDTLGIDSDASGVSWEKKGVLRLEK
eukprot:jgi/Botrbrau1/6162/Bobra.0344s0003.1